MSDVTRLRLYIYRTRQGDALVFAPNSAVATRLVQEEDMEIVSLIDQFPVEEGVCFRILDPPKEEGKTD